MQSLVPMSARRILDVGCAEGLFGAALATRPSAPEEVWGCDVRDDLGCESGGAYHRLLRGTFPDDVELPCGYFDCVVFNDVLEHMVDPWMAVRRTAGLLRPNGRVVASIPNIRHAGVSVKLLLHGRWEYSDWGILDRTHLRFFTRASIISMFSGGGFTVETIVPINIGREGKLMTGLRLAGRLTTDLRAAQYAVVARPTS